MPIAKCLICKKLKIAGSGFSCFVLGDRVLLASIELTVFCSLEFVQNLQLNKNSSHKILKLYDVVPSLDDRSSSKRTKGYENK